MREARLNATVILVYVLALLLWQLAGSAFSVPEFILPSPMAILQRAARSPGALAFHALVTLQEVVFGFLLASADQHSARHPGSSARVCSSASSIHCSSHSRRSRKWRWRRSGGLVRVRSHLQGLARLRHAMFPIVINTVVGMAQTPEEMIHLMRSSERPARRSSSSAAPRGGAAHLRRPQGRHHALDGRAVVGEFIASSSGLGNFLLIANNAFDSPLLFAIVILLSLLSVALFYAIEILEALVLPRPLRRKALDFELAARA